MIHYRTTNSLTEAFIAKQKLLDLQHLYPDFNYWFSNKCLPGIVIGSDKMIIAKHDEQIIKKLALFKFCVMLIITQLHTGIHHPQKGP